MMKRWFELIKNSQCNIILEEIKEYENARLPDGVVNFYKYIKNNIESIDYKKYKEDDLYVGSGAVEGANKSVTQSRLKLGGMRWDRFIVQYVASLRAKLCSNLLNEVEKILYQHLKILERMQKNKTYKE